MCVVSLNIPNEVIKYGLEKEVEDTKGLELYFKSLMAMDIYKRGEISLSTCAKIAEMPMEDFMFLLCKNKISIWSYNSVEELKEEIENARSGCN